MQKILSFVALVTVKSCSGIFSLKQRGRYFLVSNYPSVKCSVGIDKFRFCDRKLLVQIFSSEFHAFSIWLSFAVLFLLSGNNAT